MDVKANYVTPKRVWGCFIGRPLSNRAIKKYQAMGYYSNGVAIRVEAAKQQRTKTKLTMEELFNKFL